MRFRSFLNFRFQRKKLTLSLLLSACCLSTAILFSAPIRSNLGGEGVEGIPEQAGPTAADYVQDGLVLMLDAIENISLGVSNHNVPYVYNIAQDGPFYSVNDVTFDEEELTYSRPASGSPASLSFAEGFVEPFRNLSFTAEYYAAVEVPSSSANFWGCGADPTTNGFSFVFVALPNNRLLVSKTGTQSWSQITPTDRRHSSLVVSGFTMRSFCYGEYDKTAAIVSDGYQYCNVFSFGSAPRFGGKVIDSMRCFRLYNRELTEEEIAHNYQIDKERFGL